MKIIFSRKGFDSGNGGMPSPILPDGRMLSLPILSNSERPLSDMQFDPEINKLVSDLSDQRIVGSSCVHFDPDLDMALLPRSHGWRPSLGQVGAAQSHLENEKIEPSDIFLFFGWFRQVETVGGKWRFVPDAPHLHVLFGWLQIGEIVSLHGNESAVLKKYPWLKGHPHMQTGYSHNNTLYIATENLQINGVNTLVTGGGRFKTFTPRVQLTDNNANRSTWRFPKFFLHDHANPTMSYHKKPEKWTMDGQDVILETVKRGQEFVFDASNNPYVQLWTSRLIGEHA